MSLGQRVPEAVAALGKCHGESAAAAVETVAGGQQLAQLVGAYFEQPVAVVAGLAVAAAVVVAAVAAAAAVAAVAVGVVAAVANPQLVPTVVLRVEDKLRT